jgi:hypothetical protein
MGGRNRSLELPGDFSVEKAGGEGDPVLAAVRSVGVSPGCGVGKVRLPLESVRSRLPWRVSEVESDTRNASISWSLSSVGSSKPSVFALSAFAGFKKCQANGISFVSVPIFAG